MHTKLKNYCLETKKGEKTPKFSENERGRLIFLEVLFADYVNLKTGDCFTIQ